MLFRSDAGFSDLSTVSFELFKDLSLISEPSMNKLVASKIFVATISSRHVAKKSDDPGKGMCRSEEYVGWLTGTCDMRLAAGY